jgi:homopolymeric O-antigen transport system ATP-binding protein
MTAPVISVENLSKRYLVGHQARRIGSENHALRDAMVRHLRNAARKTADVVRGRQVVQGDEVEEFWALRDVSFEVNEGEVVGIIGRNGAGKSTLLKILSRITEPTAGRVTLRGRVASLLEVGTGFHPELSGRENIYLNGAILGMTRAEIRRKFDEIVAFADIERFLDTPVKRYSSGMYVRLAFAVAAHLEPEILIVDEVLAVGDAEFQKKCLGKMDDVARRQGRTVLVVSHNMGVINGLCKRALWLDQGSLREHGAPQEVVGKYLARAAQLKERVISLTDRQRPDWVGNPRLRIESLEWISPLPLRHGEPARARIQFKTFVPVSEVSAAVGFDTLEGTRTLTYDMDGKSGLRRDIRLPGDHAVDIVIDSLPLGPDIYNLILAFRSGDQHHLDYLESCSQIEVVSGPDTQPIIAQKGTGVRYRGTWSWENTLAPIGEAQVDDGSHRIAGTARA